MPLDARLNKNDIENQGADRNFDGFPMREIVGYDGSVLRRVKVDGSGNLIVGSSALPTGAATSANQQPPSTTPTIYNVTLTSANTEYSQALPANTREFRFMCRTLFDVRFAYTTGKVATPTAPYMTLGAGLNYFSDYNNLSSQTLYFASSTAGVVVELEVFT